MLALRSVRETVSAKKSSLDYLLEVDNTRSTSEQQPSEVPDSECGLLERNVLNSFDDADLQHLYFLGRC